MSGAQRSSAVAAAQGEERGFGSAPVIRERCIGGRSVTAVSHLVIRGFESYCPALTGQNANRCNDSIQEMLEFLESL